MLLALEACAAFGICDPEGELDDWQRLRPAATTRSLVRCATIVAKVAYASLLAHDSLGVAKRRRRRAKGTGDRHKQNAGASSFRRAGSRLSYSFVRATSVFSRNFISFCLSGPAAMFRRVPLAARGLPGLRSFRRAPSLVRGPASASSSVRVDGRSSRAVYAVHSGAASDYNRRAGTETRST